MANTGVAINKKQFLMCERLRSALGVNLREVSGFSIDELTFDPNGTPCLIGRISLKDQSGNWDRGVYIRVSSDEAVTKFDIQIGEDGPDYAATFDPSTGQTVCNPVLSFR